jgi:hypothetical protein
MAAEPPRIERPATHLVELPFRFRFGHALTSRIRKMDERLATSEAHQAPAIMA